MSIAPLLAYETDNLPVDDDGWVMQEPYMSYKELLTIVGSRL